ncbi:MAG TPA: hypothetical protein VHD37_00375 [Candidatus Paceibacterota bacterium]|nr:hypothetical protein [Candidatus Paceibacterota bacterium]
MSFPVEVINLGLYCVQQAGIMLGVGAETIILIVYFLSMRDGRVEPKEEQFGRAVHRVLRWGLALIIASGILITGLHVLLGQLDIVYQPAFLLKWILVGAVVGMEAARRKQLFAHYGWEGTAAAQWYALFILHILAPIATWADLLILYGIWFAGFTAMFVSLVHVLGVPVPGYNPQPAEHKKTPPAPKPILKPAPKPEPKKIMHVQQRPAPVVHKPAPPPAQPKPKPLPPPTPPAPKPVPLPKEEPMLPKPGPMPPPPAVIVPSASLPAVAMKPPVKPPMPIPHKPKPVIPPMPHKPHNQIPIPKKPEASGAPHHFGLPAIRVMPKSQEDVDKQNHATAVQLSEVKI